MTKFQGTSIAESATTIAEPDNSLIAKLSKIQRELKAPKSQTNAFGKYKYRSCEDILTAVKPYLDGLILKLSDEIVEVGGRVYVKATASIADGVNSTYVCGFAREPIDQKGMADAQLTGACSSYARKYALNGLFCIDDTKDADHTNNGTKVIQMESASDYVTPAQHSELMDLIDSKNVDKTKFLKWIGADAVEHVAASNYKKAKAALLSTVAK